MRKIVPLPDSRVRGPLGLAHLPRLWLKRVVAVSGLLAPEYHDGYAATNKVVMDGVGLDPEATLAYLSAQPSYREFERWVSTNARGLDGSTIAATNAAVLGARLDPEAAERMRTSVGLEDSAECGSAMLRALVDWSRVHADAVSKCASGGTLVPAISSQSWGPLGLRHLPRFWLKAILDASGALFEGWKSGQPSGFDMWFCDAVGIDVDITVAHVHHYMPTYVAFERWFATQAAHASVADIERLNAAITLRDKPDAVAAQERLVLGISDPTYKRSQEINDLIDWHELHAIAVSARTGPRSLARESK